MIIQEQILISAPIEAVWSVLADVTRWPVWTPTMTSVQGPPELAVGRTYNIRQPRFPVARWTVTDLQPGLTFTWVSRVPGLYSSASHTLSTTPNGTQLKLHFQQTGLFAPLANYAAGPLCQAYVRIEAESLRKHFEARGLTRS